MSEASVQRGGLRRLSHKLRNLLGGRNGDHEQQLRDTIEEIIGEIEEADEETAQPIGDHERQMFANILKLRHLTAYDVMIPRADIVAVEVGASLEDLIALMGQAGHSRVPVYRETLDDPIGMVHIKDVLGYSANKRHFKLANIIRPIRIVAPSMRVVDLLLEMRLKRSHMALVVDEFGGIDGLVTIEDLVEEIVGEIEDEHDVAEGPKLVWRPDGSLVADARTTIEEFEEAAGPVLSEEERDADIDTLGGLVFYLADRVPSRGELIEHPTTSIVFEVLQADPRRIKRLRLRNLPTRPDRSEEGSAK
ncbi:CBS domain-containing protein [Tistlia consotensis]|uniref:CBS domain-containing protein n=1 Tax=Tistlia consotensis USBA 355 TaxID=560819 RepID=A0A1Y6CL13_9PROT|nr:hemolysin family protein [Tistlia consotensis]SMF74471.1 CBS domain-containing protein [Tistlia consotensis USBA 355]SNS10669.1 CBS domain-containing protein [Tistlia consotensis]